MKAEDKIRKARVQLLLNHPFFGYLANYLSISENSGIERPVSTDYKNLFYNPEIVEGLNEERVEASVAHGIMHTALGHQWRCGGRSEDLWGSATDIAVDWILKDSGFHIPESSTLNVQFKDKSAEEIYTRLELAEEERKREEEKEADEKGAGDRSGATGKAIAGGDSERHKGTFDYKSVLDGHEAWKEEPGEMDQNEISEEWKRRLVESSTLARQEGRLPGALKRIVDEISQPELDWREILRKYILQYSREDYDWRRPNRRLLQYGIYYPSPRSERIDMAVAVDTSGSIGDAELKSFISEIKGILETADSYRARLLGCDARVHSDTSVSSNEGMNVEKIVNNFSRGLKGRGGTRYSPVFDALEDEEIQVAVYLTDGRCSERIEEPPYDTIWVIPEGGTTSHIDFGRIVRKEESL